MPSANFIQALGVVQESRKCSGPWPSGRGCARNESLQTGRVPDIEKSRHRMRQSFAKRGESMIAHNDKMLAVNIALLM